jgi:DNA polymerase II small subunit/DNA polymerase delta subunit B
MELISGIPDYIHMFIIPGNHDAVQLAEPQPRLPRS